MHQKIALFSDTSRTEELISPAQLMTELPLPATSRAQVRSSANTIRSIMWGKDPRLLVVVGPCSIHNSLSALEYADKLALLSKEVEDQLFLVMRVHLEKPRTTVGWKGFLYDPFLDGSSRLEVGLTHSRRLMVELVRLGIPVGCEFLDPLVPYYLGDLVSWGQIGARTSSSQIHRQMASALPMPVGIKNTVDGNIKVAAEGVLAASHPQSFLGITARGKPAIIHSDGNPDCHVVLRGGGVEGSNYHEADVLGAFECLQALQVNSRVLIDCSHDNSGKDHQMQGKVFHHVLKQILGGNRSIKGAVLESHLVEGKQAHGESPDTIHPCISLTDPCIGWKETENLIQEAATSLRSLNSVSMGINN